jgi:hypothetical protein
VDVRVNQQSVGDNLGEKVDSVTDGKWVEKPSSSTREKNDQAGEPIDKQTCSNQDKTEVEVEESLLL